MNGEICFGDDNMDKMHTKTLKENNIVRLWFLTVREADMSDSVPVSRIGPGDRNLRSGFYVFSHRLLGC